MKVTRLTCEYKVDPIGIQPSTPRLAWQLERTPGRHGEYQSAYHVLVATRISFLEENEGDLWDSGIVNSHRTWGIQYMGKPLGSREECFWKVKAWDQDGNATSWSKIAKWTTGMRADDWNASWIGKDESIPLEKRFPISSELQACPPWIKEAARRLHPAGAGPENKHATSVHLRREFHLHKKVARAIACIAGLGYHELHINGAKIGNRVLDPVASDYSKTVYYTTHDITSHVQQGDNCAGILLGGGWFWVGTPDLFGFEKAPWAAPPRCMAEIEIEFTDGTTRVILTDETWACSTDGPIRFNCIRSGEIYDARMEMDGWTRPNGIDSDNGHWQPAIIVEGPAGVLRPQLMPPMRVKTKHAPCKRVILEDGSIVYHFKENNAGWVEIAVRGKPGQAITIEMNELLVEDGHVDMNTHAGHTHGRFQTCEYICNGKNMERWHPSFTYAGFQYVQVTGIEEKNVIEILACQVFTDLEESGSFNCSNLLIDKVNEASKLTFSNGLHSYPEDCPQREKAGWTEDGLISSFGSVYNYNCLLTYEKWIQDILDAQHVDTGQVPDIVPTPGWGKPVEKREKKDFTPWTAEQLGNMADPWWGGCLVLLPWHLYQHYGDLKILEQAYPAMKAYVDFLLETTRYGPGVDDHDYLINWPTLLGDWLEVGSGGSASRTPRMLTASLAFLACASRVAKSARVLGYMEDEERYHRVTEHITSAFNEEFLDKNTGFYWKDSQSAQAMPLILGIVPKNIRSKVLTGLISNVKDERNGHLSTGIIGTYFLYKALGENKQSGVAFDVITARGKPGFEYMLTKVNPRNPVPSGTIWEDWEGKNSLSHPVQGTVVSFFYEHLAGIQVDEQHPGFEKFTISPSFIPQLQWVRASIESPQGSIEMSWERVQGEKILLSLGIPVNTTARLDLQGPLFDENGRKQESRGLELGSGVYNFTIGRG